jgi:hypothetical protein
MALSHTKNGENIHSRKSIKSQLKQEKVAFNLGFTPLYHFLLQL